MTATPYRTASLPAGRVGTVRRRLRTAALLIVTSLSLVTGITAPASGGPRSGPPTQLKAITALDSKRSELRREPDIRAAGKARARTNVKALEASANIGTPTQNMGNPADKTILQSDQLSIAKTTDGSGSGGNGTTQQAAALNSAMSEVDGTKTTPDVAEGGRAIIEHQYPTAGGRFVNGSADSVLAFRETVAGGDALWQLGSINQTAEQYVMGEPVTTLVRGATYAITQGETAITNTAATVSGPLGSQVVSTRPGNTQQWALLDAGHGDSSFALVNRADGLCLSWTEASEQVSTAPCIDDQTRHWYAFNRPGGTIAFYPTADGEDDNKGVGSSSGTASAGDLVTGTDQSWTFQPISEPGGSVPTWSVPRTSGATAGHITAPYDMSAGDLDGVVSADGLYHDEAVVAYTDSDDNWAIRVIDYNANPSQLLVSAPDPTIDFATTGGTSGGRRYPGSLTVQIGDFDGDGTNEILTGFQDGNGDLTVDFWRYSAQGKGERQITLVNSHNCAACSLQPFKGSGPAQTMVSGYTDTAVGDFDGDGATDLGVAFATSTKTPWDSTQLTPNLGVVTFNADLTMRSVELTRTGIAHYLPLAVNGDPTRTGAGLQLQSGVFTMDPAKGFGYQRRELAMSWVSVTYKGTYACGLYDSCDAYGRQPQFQLYAVNNADCPANSTYAVCTDTAPMSSEQSSLSSPYPTHTTTYDLVKADSGQPDVQPMVMVAGAYGGATAADPPVWGLWFLQWRRTIDLDKLDDPSYGHEVATSIVVPWKSATDPTGVKITDSYIENASNHPVYYGVTAYDRSGDSVILGSPVVFDVDNSKRLEMLAAQPPKHADLLNGELSNATISNDYYLSTTSSSGTEWSNTVSNENSYSNGGSTEESAKATLAGGLGPFDAGSSAQLSQSFKAAWTGSNTSSSDSTGSHSTTITAAAVDDDVIGSSYNDYQVYRYPVLGNLAGGTTCDGRACNPYYEVTVPGSTVWVQGAGMSDADYAPTWTNDNALSYPVIDGDTVALPDAGPYTDGSGTTQTKALYNQANPLGGDNTGAVLKLDSGAEGDSTVTSGHTWESDTELDLSASVTVGVPEVDGASFDFSSTNGFQASKTFLKTVTASIKTTAGTDFELKASEIPSDKGYEVGTAVYYSSAGTPKVVHAVNLDNSSYGTYFTSNYTSASDVALNLPGRMVVDKDTDDLYQDPYLSTSYARQLVRGFKVLQVGGSSSLLPTQGLPFSGNPTSGAQLQFSVPVSNLSLTAMPATTTAHFYAVPVDAWGVSVTGAAIDLNEATQPVPALGPQGTTTITSQPWTAPNVSDAQQYRIFVVLNEGGTMPEVHPLNGSDCPTGVLDPNGDTGVQALFDLMSTDADAPDPTGCGQNNQGYGLVTISPAATAATGSAKATHGSAKKPANVTLDGAGLLDGIKGHRKLDARSSVPVVPLNANLRGIVYTKADLHAVEGQPVLVYDGEPSKGKLVYAGRTQGTSSRSGGAMTFSWHPSRPGLHELHTVILGSATTGQDDEQILRVWVDGKPRARQFSVTASAEKPAIDVGGSVRILGTVSPILSRAGDREVLLQVKKDDLWVDLGAKSTAADGTYAFTVKPRTQGTYTYRVKKAATSELRQAYSPTVTVKVTQPFVVTAQAKPPKIKLRKKTTISGWVTPTVSAISGRSVVLQVKKGSSWKKVSTEKTAASGRFSFKVKPSKKGTYHYRVFKPAAEGKRAAYSPTIKVTVTRR